MLLEKFLNQMVFVDFTEDLGCLLWPIPHPVQYGGRVMDPANELSGG